MFTWLFFFSSRRRHSRFDCDWSSDVCSSDLSSASCAPAQAPGAAGGLDTRAGAHDALERSALVLHVLLADLDELRQLIVRSEERRVGKEGRSRWTPYL